MWCLSETVLPDGRRTPGVHLLGESGEGFVVLLWAIGLEDKIFCSSCLAWSSLCFIPFLIQQ